jgi:hypothetical protein
MIVRIGRRQLLAGLGGAAVWPLAARGQQQATPARRVGVLMSIALDDPEAHLRVAAFEAGLRDLGWVQGRNLTSSIDGRPDRRTCCTPRLLNWLPACRT